MPAALVCARSGALANTDSSSAIETADPNRMVPLHGSESKSARVGLPPQRRSIVSRKPSKLDAGRGEGRRPNNLRLALSPSYSRGSTIWHDSVYHRVRDA